MAGSLNTLMKKCFTRELQMRAQTLCWGNVDFTCCAISDLISPLFSYNFPFLIQRPGSLYQLSRLSGGGFSGFPGRGQNR